MPEKKYTLQQVADIADAEGLDYAIQHYMSGDSIEDPKLAIMWDQAKNLIDEIQHYIENEMRNIDPDWEWS